MQDLLLLMNLIYIQKKILIMKDGYFQVRSFMKNKQKLKFKEYVYGAISRKAKFYWFSSKAALK